MIEDEPHHVRLIDALLARSRYGRYELTSASSAQEALAKLTENDFDAGLNDEDPSN